jgi:hypothetical protein
MNCLKQSSRLKSRRGLRSGENKRRESLDAARHGRAPQVKECPWADGPCRIHENGREFVAYALTRAASRLLAMHVGRVTKLGLKKEGHK